MSKTSTNYTGLHYVKEDSIGVTPTNPTFQTIPSKGSSLQGNITTAVSMAIRSDRQTDDLILVDSNVNGSLDVELSFTPYLDFLQSLLQDNNTDNFNALDGINLLSATGNDFTFLEADNSLNSVTPRFLGLTKGDTIFISDALNPENNGQFTVAATATATKVLLTTDRLVTEATSADMLTVEYPAYHNDVSFTKATKSITSTAYSFAGLVPGDKIYVKGATNKSNNGQFTVKTAPVAPFHTVFLKGVRSNKIVDEAAGALVRFRTPSLTAVNDISFNTGTGPTVNEIISSTTSFATFVSGSFILVSGAANAANNGVFEIATVAPHKITLTNDKTLVDEPAGNGIKITQNVFRNGNANVDSYTFLKTVEGIANQAYMYYKGCQISSLSLDFTTGSILGGSFGIVGLNETTTTTPLTNQSLVDIPTYSLLNSVSSLSIVSTGLSAGTSFQNIKLNIDNSVNAAKAIGTLGATDLASFMLNVTADMSIYFEDLEAYNMYKSASSFKVVMTLVDGDGNYIVISLPHCKFEKLDSPVPGKDAFLMQNGSFRALRDPTLDYTIQMDLLAAH